MRWWIALGLVALLGTACTPDTAPTTTTAPPTETTTTTAAPDVEPCRTGDLAFGTDGLVAALGEDSSDATRVSQIRWEPGTTCERLVISFATESGAPAATLGPTGVTVVPTSGIVHIDLPEEMTASAVADMWTDGAVIDRTFVVRNDAGRMRIDVHTAPGTAIEARAVAAGSPATLIIDVAPRPDLPPTTPAAIADTAVITAPPPGPSLYPFTVEGYAPPAQFSTNVLLRSNDVSSVDLSIALSGYTDTWQAFSTRIDDGPSGQATLFVGTKAPDGAPDTGASVVLDLP